MLESFSFYRLTSELAALYIAALIPFTSQSPLIPHQALSCDFVTVHDPPLYFDDHLSHFIRKVVPTRLHFVLVLEGHSFRDGFN